MGKNLHTKLENIKNLAQNFVQKSTDSFGKKYTIFAPKIQATDTLALSFEIHMTEGEKTTNQNLN